MSDSDSLFHNGHRSRLKDKLLDDKLTSYEKLELLLTYAIPRRDVRPLARELLHRFRSVHNVIHASIEDLKLVPGIGHNTALLIHLVHELIMIAHNEYLSDGNILYDTTRIKEYCRCLLGGQDVEELHVLYLDKDYRLLLDEKHSRGTTDCAIAYPKEIARRGCILNASFVILLHNHPMSDNMFSQDDLTLTEQIISELAKVGIGYVDHYLVVSNGTVYSLEENKWMYQNILHK